MRLPSNGSRRILLFLSWRRGGRGIDAMIVDNLDATGSVWGTVDE
jgi:hypothetical protein